jgi:hypothetical protein
MALNAVQSTEDITTGRPSEGSPTVKETESKAQAPLQEASHDDELGLGGRIDSLRIKEGKAESTQSPVGRAVDFRV